MNRVLLQSTFTCLLQVTLDQEHRLLDVRRLADRHGVYFGLTRHQNHVFAVARNLDVNERVPDPARPSNNIVRLSWPWRDDDQCFWSIPDTRGVHQIRFHDGLLWLMNCRHPELIALDPERGTRAGQLALAALVPPELRHEPPPEVPMDCYHFNSLYFSGDRLLVLAHNWGYGSFVLELAYAGPAALFHDPRVVGVYPDLGLQSHDVYAEDGSIYVLDSGNGRLLASSGMARAIGPAYQERHCFARGLAVGQDFLYAGHGTFSTRANRVNGPTQITVLDRRSLATVAVVDVGPYGNPCDLLLMSEPDLSDLATPPTGVAGFWPGLVKKLWPLPLRRSA
jgi:hypothetical protein